MTQNPVGEADEDDFWRLVGAVMRLAMKEARAGDPDALEFLAVAAPDRVWERLNLPDELPTRPIRKR